MIGAVIAAVIILSLIISIYSTTPIRVENPQGNTDYVWKPDSLWLNMSEGVSFGKMDAKGFNNPKVVDDPDIILLGSSHLESKNVNQNENMAYYLCENLDNRYSVYNMGISGHTIYKVCQYLPKTLSLYQNHIPKYVIIETDNIVLNREGVNAVLSHSVEKTPVYDSGLIATLNKIPAFRQIYSQLNSGLNSLLLPELMSSDDEEKESPDNQEPIEVETETEEEEKNDNSDNNQEYDSLLAYLEDLQEQYKTKIIIVFHPFEYLSKDAVLCFENNYTAEIFAEYAQKHNIAFIDMAERFDMMFLQEHHLPHGFITGEIGAGHLNKYGHKAIADALYDTITGLED